MAFARRGLAITQSAPADRKAATSSSRALPVIPNMSLGNPFIRIWWEASAPVYEGRRQGKDRQINIVERTWQWWKQNNKDEMSWDGVKRRDKGMTHICNKSSDWYWKLKKNIKSTQLSTLWLYSTWRRKE